MKEERLVKFVLKAGIDYRFLNETIIIGNQAGASNKTRLKKQQLRWQSKE